MLFPYAWGIWFSEFKLWGSIFGKGGKKALFWSKRLVVSVKEGRAITDLDLLYVVGKVRL